MTIERPWEEWARRILGLRKIGEMVTLEAAAQLYGATVDDVRDSGIVVLDMPHDRRRRQQEGVRLKDLWLIYVESCAGRQGLNRRWGVLDTLAYQPLVYLLRGGGLTKIGYSTDVKARLAAIRSHSPAPVQLVWLTPGGVELERSLHEEFAPSRRHGEWFALSLDELRDLSNRLPLPPRVTKRGATFAHACHCGKVYETSRSWDNHKQFGHRPPLREQILRGVA